MTDPKDINEEELKASLGPEAYQVLRERGTEAPFSGKYVHAKDKGMYKCKVCGTELFSSDTKFDSGTGWPSFDDAIPGRVELREDNEHGMQRTEVVCKNCGSHLGHVFDDVPAGKQAVRQDGGLATKRYCINSVCLDLDKT
jgi:peptide-methionine (R)-S-oxide reductase